MKTNGNDVAFASASHSPAGDLVYGAGLTKREYFAAMAMQGLLASDTDACMDARDAARIAVLNADALIAALNDGGGE